MAKVVYGWPGLPQRVVYGWPGARTVVDVPVVVQRAEKTSEIPQTQILDRFVGMPVVEASLVLTVQKPVEIQRVQILDKLLQ